MTYRSRRRWIVMAAVAILLLSFISPASASSHLSLSTRFPGLTVKPGEQLSLSLDVTNTGTPGIVNLKVMEMPMGWDQPALRGGGFAVSQVFVGSGKSESVTLDVKVPEKAAEGIYRVVLQAEGPTGRSTLPVELKVASQGTSRATMTTQYPSIKAQAGTSYTFRVDLRNDSDSKQMFALSANPPRGWDVTFKPAYESKQIGTIPVDAHSTQGVDVDIRIPSQVDAGPYRIPVMAGAGSLQARMELELDVQGRYDLKVSTPTGRLTAEATAGRENPLTLEISNTGTAPLTEITFSASAPPNWSVIFTPDKIDKLEPGETRQIEAKVNPDSKAIAGDYLMSISARDGESSASNRAEFRVAVQTSTLWGAVGALILAGVAGGVWWVFRAYGRR